MTAQSHFAAPEKLDALHFRRLPRQRRVADLDVDDVIPTALISGRSVGVGPLV
jgi:hypothetical protein